MKMDWVKAQIIMKTVAIERWLWIMKEKHLEYISTFYLYD
jgi:hypothetical protein